MSESAVTSSVQSNGSNILTQTAPTSQSSAYQRPSQSNSRPEEHQKEKTRLRKERHGWRHHIQNFTPSWFSVTMGTGITSILLHTLSTTYHSPALNIISIIIFVLNILLFAACLVASILRYTMYPAVWNLMMKHPTQSLFLGTFPMGFATLINMFVFVCVPSWGEWAMWTAWGMWWLDVVVSVATCVALPFIMSVPTQSTPRPLQPHPSTNSIFSLFVGCISILPLLSQPSPQ